MIGQVIGNFRVVALLGRGGMGEVFVAEHVGIATRVAVKVLLPEISTNTDHVHRLFNEARIVGRIKHAGIARIFDVGFHAEQAYLVMELLEGESLAARIRRTGGLAPVELADIGRQIASVLAATHAAGVTHRDLKPDNIYLVPDAELGRGERVKVLDFGIAKLSGGSGPRTIGTMGTPAYMAPEQWGNSACVDWRADAYSLGCVLFEMATSRPPFSSATIAEAYTQHTQTAPPSPRTTAPQLPREIEALVMQLLAKDPAARGSSMTEIALRLEPWCGYDSPARGTGPYTAITASSAPHGWSRSPTTLGGSAGELAPVRRRGAAFATVLGIVGAVLAIAVVGLTMREPAGSTAASAPPPPSVTAVAQPTAGSPPKASVAAPAAPVVTTESSKIVPVAAPPNSAPASAPANSAPVVAPEGTAPVRTAPVRTAPVRTAPARTAPVRTAPARTAPAHTAPPKRAQPRTRPAHDTELEGRT